MAGNAQKEETPVPGTVTNDGRGSSGVNEQIYGVSGSGASYLSISIDAIKLTLSEERFAPYVHDGADDRTGMARYSLNMSLCQALYPGIHCLEVALRNAIHRELAIHEGSDSWYDSLSMLSPQQRTDLSRATDKLRRMPFSLPITPGRVVAELSLGFWTAFFNKRNAVDALSSTLVQNVFRHAPKSTRSRRTLDDQLTTFRNLRNRVFHHERILHWKNLDETHAKMMTTISWICPHVAQVAQKHDNFKHVRQEGLRPWLS
jgi:hypothetical protein